MKPSVIILGSSLKDSGGMIVAFAATCFWDADTGTRRFSQSNRQSIAGRYMRKKIVPLLFLLIIGAESCATKELRVQEFRVAAGTPDPGNLPKSFML